jgi:hypothetical protein
MALNIWSLAPTSHAVMTVRKMSFGRVGVRRGQHAAHLLEADAVFVEHPRVQFHPHAGSELPPTITCPTPLICDSFCAMMDEAASYIWALVRMGDVSASSTMGESDGFTFR